MDEEKLMSAIRKAEYKYRNNKEDPEKRAKYMRNWKAKHPEKQNEYNKRFYLKKAIEYGIISPEEVGDLNSEELYKTIYQYRKEKGYAGLKEEE